MKPNDDKISFVSLDGKWRDYVLARVRIVKGCWIWAGGMSPGGYGVGSVNRYPAYAHRISYFAFKGKPPKNHRILHNCNNRRCVNPGHLRSGTIRENTLDSMIDGTWKPIPLSKSRKVGSLHGKAKLDENKVLRIRKLYNSGGVYQKDLAHKFKVSRSTVQNITSGRNWKHI